MITSLTVGAVFKIIDEASPVLERLSRQVSEFNKLVATAKKGLGELGNVKFPGLETSLKKLSDQAAMVGTKMDASLRSIVGSTDTAITSVDRLAASWDAVAASTRLAAAAAARASAPAAATGAIGGGGVNPRQRIPGPHGSGAGGLSYYSYGIPVPGGHLHPHGGTPALVAAGAVAGGLYEYAELVRDASRAVWAMHGGNMPDQATQDAEQKQYIDIVMKAAGETGKSFKVLSAVAQAEVRQSAGVPWERRMQGLPGLLAQAASEADLRGEGTSVQAAGDSLIAYAHMLKVYDPVEMQKLYPGLSYLAMRSPQTLKRITTAAGYHMPQGGVMEIDPIEEMVLQTGLERAGIQNTKSGTWLRELAQRALPPLEDKTKPSVYADKMDALRELGLVGADGKPTWFTNGKPDELKMLHIAGEHAQNIPLERRGLLERYIFGTQGGGAMGVLADPKLLPQLDTMEGEAKGYRAGTDYFKYMYNNSPIQQFSQSWIDLQKVLVDIGTIAMPPVLGGLQMLDGWLKSINQHFPSSLAPKKESFGEALGKGMGAGAIPGALLGSAIPGVGTLTGAAGGALIGGAISGGNWIYDQLLGGATRPIDSLGHEISKTGDAASAATGPMSGLAAAIKSLPGGSPGKTGEPGEPAHKMNFLQGPKQVTKPQPVSLSLNIDGRTLAQAISEIQSALYEFPGGAPAANGLTAWNDGDHNFATT